MHGTMTRSVASLKEPTPARRSRWLVWAVTAWVAIYAMLTWVSRKAIAAVEMRDPDDQLRLQQVRDLLAGQGWFDLHQYRIDAIDGGVLMHWSRLVDAPVAGIILMMRPLIGEANAELTALVAVPALTLFVIVAVVAWMGSRMLPTRAAQGFSLLALGFAAPVLVQLQPLRIDHHAWQIALAAIAMAAFVLRDHRRGGWVTGAALAAWMAISFEGLPMSAWFVAVTALMALYDPVFRPRLVATVQSLAIVSGLLFLATRGFADLAVHCDAISPVHLAIFAWGAVTTSLAALFRRNSRAWLASGLGMAGIGALGIVFVAAPQCTAGSFDMLDPVVREVWYDRVQEGKSVFLLPFGLMAQYILPPAFGLAGAVVLARRTDGHARGFWSAYALVTAGALAVGMVVSRSGSIPSVLAALPLGWLFAHWITHLRRPESPLLRVGELVAVALLIFTVLLPIVPATALAEIAPLRKTPVHTGELSLACSAADAAEAMAALPEGAILAPLDFGPDILLATDRSVLASGHHRGATAMRAEIDAFTGTPDRARAIMAEKHLKFVVICPEVQEMDVYRKIAPSGFAARLLANRPPPWLRPVPLPRASGLRMWQVVE